MVRTIIKFAVFLLCLNAAGRVALAYVDYARFKDRLSQLAMAVREHPESEIVGHVLELGGSMEIPVAAEGVRVRKEPNHTYIDVTYTEQLRLLPNTTYPWTFNITADGWVLRPTTVDDVLGRD
jgi:hypothetical protein